MGYLHVIIQYSEENHLHCAKCTCTQHNFIFNKQRIFLNSPAVTFLQWRLVSHGVHQGTGLGPLSFLPAHPLDPSKHSPLIRNQHLTYALFICLSAVLFKHLGSVRF